jgi:hypothetical protein
VSSSAERPERNRSSPDAIEPLKATRKIAAEFVRILAAPRLARSGFRLPFFRRGLRRAVELDELCIDPRKRVQRPGIAFGIRRAAPFILRLPHPHFDLLDLAIDGEIEPRALGTARALDGLDLALPAFCLGVTR